MPSNNKAFGLDIGVTSIKAVWLSRDKSGFFLTSSVKSAIPPRGMLSQSPLDEEEMANYIRRIVENGKISTKNVNVSLPEDQVFSKVIEMPPLSDRELGLAIHWEAEQFIPVSLSSITLAWMVLNPPGQKKEKPDKKLKVLVVGAPISLIDKYQRIITMAKLNLVTIETELLSIVRALMYQKDTSSFHPPTIILSIGSISTVLALVKDGVINLTYFLPVGGMAVNRALQVDLGLSAMQAEEYKKTYGVAKTVQYEKVGRTIGLIFGSVVWEIKKVLAFYSEQYKGDVPVQQILLTGGIAKMPGIDVFFAENTGIETVIADPWATVLSPKATVAEDVKQNASIYTIAIGLAMIE